MNTTSHQSMRIVPQMPHHSSVNDIARSPDGTLLASASDDATVRLWDATDLTLVGVIDGHYSSVLSVAWNPKRSEVVSACWDGALRIWDVEYSRFVRRLEGHKARIFSVIWSPDGERIASCSFDNTLKIWEASTGDLLMTLDAPKPSNVTWSGTGDRIACGCGREIRIWNADSGKITVAFEGHEDWVTCVAWCPTESIIATAAKESISFATKGSVTLWDAHSGHVMWSRKYDHALLNSLAWNDDGHKLAIANFETVEILDLKPRKIWSLLERCNESIDAMVWSPNGKQLAAAAGCAVATWDAASGQLHDKRRSTNEEPTSLAWSCDAKMVAIAFGNVIQVRDVVHGSLSCTIEEVEDSVSVVSFDHDGTRIASAGDDAPVKIWDTTTGRIIREMKGFHFGVNSLAWGPQGETIAASSVEGICIWKTSTGRVQVNIEGSFSSLALSTDGSKIAAACDSIGIGVWDSRTGTQLWELTGHEHLVRCVAWEPGGERLVSASDDCTVRIWDAITGNSLITLTGHSTDVRCVAWDPQGHAVASASDDLTVRIWDVNSGKVLHVVEGSLEAHLSYLAPGFLAITTINGYVDLWDLSGSQEDARHIGRLYTEPPITGLIVVEGNYVSGTPEALEGIRLVTGSTWYKMNERPDLVSPDRIRMALGIE